MSKVNKYRIAYCVVCGITAIFLWRLDINLQIGYGG